MLVCISSFKFFDREQDDVSLWTKWQVYFTCTETRSQQVTAAVNLCACILEMPCSTLHRSTGHPDWDVSWFFSVLLVKLWHIIKLGHDHFLAHAINQKSRGHPPSCLSARAKRPKQESSRSSNLIQKLRMSGAVLHSPHAFMERTGAEVPFFGEQDTVIRRDSSEVFLNMNTRKYLASTCCQCRLSCTEGHSQARQWNAIRKPSNRSSWHVVMKNGSKFILRKVQRRNRSCS